MFNLIIWILIVVILVRLAKLIGAKTNEVKSRTKKEILIKMELVETQALIFYADAKISPSIMERNNFRRYLLC